VADTPFLASAIVRTYNSAGTVADTLASLRRQDVPVEIVVVDSGSDDATLEVVAADADVVVRLARSEFTYGRALNAGAAVASASMHVALSSHCALPREDWVRIARAHLDAGAGAVVGLAVDGEGGPLDAPFVADRDYLVGHQHWGLSNHASAWSAEVWRRHRFSESLAATEDKEWSWRALEHSGPLIVDPRLVVPGEHRRSAGARAYYRRRLKEIATIHELRPLPAYGLRRAVGEWVSKEPTDPFTTNARRCGRTRLIEVAARWRAGRLV
jgi:rhamnosyltransferase